MTREIALTNGGVTLVDDGDFDWLNRWRWQSACGNRYVARAAYNEAKKRVGIVYMHRLIMDAPAGLTVDHVDNDGFNNTRANLRLATQGQNNTHRRSFSKSGHKGVYVGPNKGAWIATYGSGENLITIGTFYNEADAARARDAYAAIYGDEFTIFNFPDETPLTLAGVESLLLVQHKLNPTKERMTSRYRGVSFYPTRRTWRAAFRGVLVGYFKSEVDGARAYDERAKQVLGSKARLNFPQEA